MHRTAGFRLCYMLDVTGPPPVMSIVGFSKQVGYMGEDPINGTTKQILFQAQQDHATELVVRSAVDRILTHIAHLF